MQNRIYLIAIVFFMLSQNINAQTPECNQTNVQLIINSGDWAEEISWSISDANDSVVDTLSVNYLNNIEYVHSLCLSSNSCYLFNLYDSYGDGWNDGTYLFQHEDSITISSGTLVGATVFGSIQFCINETSLCTSNYFSFKFITGTWAEEVSWSITDNLLFE